MSLLLALTGATEPPEPEPEPVGGGGRFVIFDRRAYDDEEEFIVLALSLIAASR